MIWLLMRLGLSAGVSATAIGCAVAAANDSPTVTTGGCMAICGGIIFAWTLLLAMIWVLLDD